MLDDFPLAEHFVLGNWLPTYRPGFAFISQFVGRAFHANPRGYYLTLGVIMAATGAFLYVTLRKLGLSTLPAALAGAAIVAFPHADALGLWWTGSQMGISLCLGLLSLYLGAMWVERSGRSLLLLALSLITLAACILVYEGMLLVFTLGICLLPLAANKRRQLMKSGADLAVAIGAALYMFHVSSSIETKKRPLGTYPGRAVHVAADGWRALFLHGLRGPTLYGAVASLSIAVAIVILLVIVKATGRLTQFGPWKPLLFSLPLLLAGVFVAWVPYVATNDWYDPLLMGVGNHINELPAVFYVTAGSVGLLLLCRLLTAPLRSPVATALLVGMIGVVVISGFVGQVRVDQQQFALGSHHRLAILATVRRVLPHPEAGATILVANYDTAIGPDWVEVFETYWDTGAALQTMYNDPHITAAPLALGAVCEATGLAEPRYNIREVSYSRLQIIDISHDRLVHLGDQEQCRSELKSLLARPWAP